MDAVILCDFRSGDADLRTELLARIAPLALSGEGRLSFVATDCEKTGGATGETIAVAFAKASTAWAVLGRWRADPDFPPSVRTRLLRIEPIWSMEPLVVMFP